ncbi:MAG: hypothetical protein ACK41G_12070 [Candidatus Thermochlorobacter sp.]
MKRMLTLQPATHPVALATWRILALTLLLNLSADALIAQNLKQYETNDPFPLTVADIEKVFGKGFQATKPTKIGEIFSCRFEGKNYTIHVSIQPMHGMSLADFHGYASPTSWKPIANDPDGAMIEIRDDKKDDFASTPAIEYVRKDTRVRLQVLGSYYTYDNRAQMPKLRDEMRMKLAKVRRIP